MYKDIETSFLYPLYYSNYGALTFVYRAQYKRPAVKWAIWSSSFTWTVSIRCF